MPALLKYSFVFFDLDRTLWDFDANSAETLQEIYYAYNMDKYISSFSYFLEKWNEYNESLWEKYRNGEIDKHILRNMRFRLTLEYFGIDGQYPADSMNTEYMRTCPHKGLLCEGAIELLNYLVSRKYRLSIISNGFSLTQRTKLESSGLSGYFEKIFTSEWAGSSKPKPIIFRKAFSCLNAPKSRSIMIGDDPVSDIRGAANFGIDQIMVSPYDCNTDIRPTFKVNSLMEIITRQIL